MGTKGHRPGGEVQVVPASIRYWGIESGKIGGWIQKAMDVEPKVRTRRSTMDAAYKEIKDEIAKQKIG